MGYLRCMMPFTRWIDQFKKENSDRGILARWISSYDFLRLCTEEEVINKMKKVGCTDALIDIFEKCWIEFELVPNAKISIMSFDGRGRRFRKTLKDRRYG